MKTLDIPINNTRVGRIRSSILGVLLAVALAVTGLVTFRAWVSSRQERAVVQRVLRDYAAFASFQLQQNFEVAANSCLREWFKSAGADGATSRDISRGVCGNVDARRFDIDFTKPSNAVPAWLPGDILSQRGMRLRQDWRVGLLSGRLRDGSVVAYAVQKKHGKALHAVGFVSASARQWLLDAVLAQSKLLPPAISQGIRSDSIFDAHILAGGQQAPSTMSEFGYTTVLPAEFGAMRLSVQLKPQGVTALVGKIPDDRTLELFALFVLAMGLVSAAIMMLHREALVARMQAAFVSSVSHELRTPLAQIRMFAEMLVLGRVRSEADRARSLDIIDKEARRLSHLVENVLQVARNKRGNARVNPAETRLAPIVRETVESFTMLTSAHRIEFRLELQEDLMVPVDTEALRQILLNLLDNAAKYGPDGQRVVVGLALFGERARLWVDDEGAGVPVRERDKVFETFYRARRDIDAGVVGSGIGLSVVRELAVLHGGAAWLTDAPPHGTRAVVEFPGAYITGAQSTDWAVA